MAILASIFGLVGRFAGKLLSTSLGWASTLLFGRVPQSKQILLALITLGSLAWVAMLAGVVVPDVGTFLLAAIPVPDFVDESWVRVAMLIGAIATPLVIGAGGMFVGAGGPPADARQIAVQVLRGYPLAALLAGILVFLGVVAIVRKVRSLSKRWTDAHVPIVVRPGGYSQLVDDLEAAIDASGLEVVRGNAPAVLAMPGRLVGRVAGAGVRSLVPDQLAMLTGDGIEIGIYPSDIAISGSRGSVARARAALTSRLATTSAYLTTSAEAQRVEDRLERLTDVTPSNRGLAPAVVAELAVIDEVLAALSIDHDEWETLYRIRIQVERDLLAGQRVGSAFPGAEGSTVPGESARLPAWAPAAGFASLGLIVLDLGLAVVERWRAGSSRA